MANSRSNIYPIQLQGAELNLNKFDAEIKQYRGFNKNNSPFVGGCLSNIFVKNIDIADSTPDNTIIDSEGNIYRVTTEGFFKNDEKVISYNNYSFIECEKIKVNTNVLKIFSDKIFLIKKEDGYYLNDIYLGQGRDNYFSNSEFASTYSCGVWTGGGSTKYFTFACFIKSSQNLGSTYFVRIVKLRLVNNVMTVVTDYTDTNRYYADADIKNHGMAIIGDFSSCNVIFTKEVNGRTDSIYIYKMSTDTPIYKEFVSGDQFATYDSSANAYNTSSYHVTLGSDNKFRLQFYSAPFNLMVYDVLDLSHDSSTDLLQRTIYAVYLNNPFQLREQILIYDSIIKGFLTQSSLSGYTNSQMKSLKNELPVNSVVRFNVGYLENDSKIIFYGITPFWLQKDGDSYKLTGGATYSNNDRLVGTAYMTLNNFEVLINNGTISGIAVSKDNNKILVSEWNNIKAESISYIENGIIYGDYDNNYYILKLTNKPKIKMVYNQIVSNVLYNHNSWFIKESKAGYYAPGFNCSPKKFGLVATSELTLFTKTAITEKYTAFSINEYNLKNNASILLNPIRIMKQSNIYYGHYPEGVNFANVNRYENTDGEVAAIYKNSYIMQDTYELETSNDELLGLPYPTDTNGNVSYCPNLFSEIENTFGNQVMIKNNNILYFLQKENNMPVMSFYLAGGVENVAKSFIIQGIFYAIMNNGIYSVVYNNGVTDLNSFVVDITGLQFVGNTPYEALFFSKTNKCLYSFTGANVLQQKQFVDKVSEIKEYLYNPATQTVFLVTDIGLVFYGLFGQFILDYTDILRITLLDNGIVITTENGKYYFIKYYITDSDEGFKKQNIKLETCFYGMNNETVTINDCLYIRLFSEEHEEGSIEVSATTLSLQGRKTEKTTFRIKASDWDVMTHTIYLRYQPKEQRGLGISFSIDSPFKIASLSVGSQADAVLVDKISKKAITAPSATSNNDEW